LNVCLLSTVYPKQNDDFNGIYVHRLAKAFVKMGIEVHVVAPHAKELKKDEEFDGVFIHRFQYMYPASSQSLTYFPGISENLKKPFNRFQVFPFAVSMTKKLIEVVRKYKIDVINAHWGIPSGFLATSTKKFHRKPVMITLYGAELFPLEKRKSKFLRKLITDALNHAEKVVGISDATCRVAKKFCGRNDIEVLPDGIDTETFNPKLNGEEIKKRYNLKNHFLVFSSGRMVERKGFKYLIEAIPYILKKSSNTKTILGGDGPERLHLENLTKSLKIEENVIFSGFIPNGDFPKYMKACDVFVLPSIVDDRGDTEGSATILLEAMACGVPIVGTKVGGIPYAIKDGIGGFLVEEKNPKELAEKILMSLEDEALRTSMGKMGSKYVEEKFSWLKIAQRYQEEFEKLI